ncbi:MAG TPA: phage integrase N-terminal SAM-like domain-containing protein [Verrucomicrobiae bacterium]|jgi:site-specific recombinase XerD|nr:phage integrase N-terminal SAM-like domain-containing protein [Verrucomicrobiae bacterium]
MNTNEAVRRLTEVIRRKHLALATERTYCAWLRRYCDFIMGLPLPLPSEHKLERFLTVLAKKDVAASTQNQAFNAIVFYFKFVINELLLRLKHPRELRT